MRNLYKKLSFVMVMGISLSSYAAWNGDATAWTQGDGSEQTPFLIENEAQLSHLQQTVTAGETYQGKFFRLTADLDRTPSWSESQKCSVALSMAIFIPSTISRS